ncbi:MAG: ABC transporter ATP-binding protein [bacterium]|nr:ABC transporter ATP-binding protein [bacterium]
MLAIEIENLKKTYKGGLNALKGINLTVPDGGFFGLLGPNGAGKSTTIGIICSLIQKTSGTCNIFGHNIDTELEEAKRHLGVVPQEFNFNIFEKCIQTVINQAGYYGVPAHIAEKRANQLFKDLGLWEKRNTIAHALSGGMKRRLMIARALVHQPRLLILDEPTAGVDISLRRHMWEFLEQQNRNGLTIILTTHYLEEAEQLCKNIAIIDKGNIIENDSTPELLKKLKSETVCLTPETPLPNNFQLDGFKSRIASDGDLEVELSSDISITELLATLNALGIVVSRMSNKANRLEELFLRLVEGPSNA